MKLTWKQNISGAAAGDEKSRTCFEMRGNTAKDRLNIVLNCDHQP